MIRAGVRPACSGSVAFSVAMLTACTSLIMSCASASCRAHAGLLRTGQQAARPHRRISVAQAVSSSESVPSVARSAEVMLRLVLLNPTMARIQPASASSGDSARAVPPPAR